MENKIQNYVVSLPLQIMAGLKKFLIVKCTKIFSDDLQNSEKIIVFEENIEILGIDVLAIKKNKIRNRTF